MASLISPGVSVSITDESFFIQNSAITVPLIFIATEDEKTQLDGITPAPGTYESNVIRTVTSQQQALDLYGVPHFVEDSSGFQYHGDARNEYGLDALHKFLGVGNRAFVLRANVNLNDDIVSVRSMWDSKTTEATVLLENLATTLINEYNSLNGYIPGDATQGYQDVNYNPALVGTSASGLLTQTYDFTIAIDGAAAVPVSVPCTAGDDIDQVLVNINAALLGATADLINGNIRVTSNSSGTTSTITITPGTVPLFSALPGFTGFAASVVGVDLYKDTITGSEFKSLVDDSFEDVFESFSFKTLDTWYKDDQTGAPLDVFANGYTAPATATYIGLDGLIDDWVANLFGGLVGDEFLPAEAANLALSAADDFKYTKEFKNGISLGANDAARRVAITTAFQALINTNQEIRSENFEYNLILCPGYPETIDELTALCVDINEEAFVIADTPINMDASETVGWAGTNARVTSTSVGYYYPPLLTSNLDGKNIVSSASAIALRTITNSDNVSELWFAPAGTRRGLVSGATDVGYVSGQLGGPTTFVPLHANVGQRDDLYKYFTNVNPIVFFPGRGIVVYGQKTSSPDSSALDRINVSRLVKYVKRSLRKNTLPFVFEPNDALTRSNIKAMITSFLNDLIVKRGLYDFAVIVDESNNTPDRIDRNELYIDIALKPTKAAEFIYIPIRVVATGADI